LDFHEQLLIRNITSSSVHQTETSQHHFGVLIHMQKLVQSKVNCFSGFSAFKI